MSMDADRRQDWLNALSWGAGVVLALSLTAAVWGAARDSVLDRAMRRDDALVITTERLLSSLKDVETGERGFVIIFN